MAAVFLLVGLASAVLPMPAEASPASYFTGEELSLGRERASAYRILYFVRLGVSVLFLSGLLGFGGAGLLARWARRLARGRSVPAALLYAAFFVLLATLVSLPLDFLAGWWLPHRFGLATAGPGRWALDALLSLAVYGGLKALLGGSVVLLLQRLQGRFWIGLWAGVVVLGAAAVFVKPVVLDPLFNDFRVLEEGPLRASLLDLSRRAGVPVDEIYVMDASRRTRAVNAYYTGLLSTRRIVLYDTLIEGFPEAEVVSVVAHEAGHWRHGHVVKGFLLFVLASGAFLWLFSRWARWAAGRGRLTGWDDPALLPALALAVILLFVAGGPVEGVVSRSFERQADRAELALTGDGEAFVAVMQRLVRRNRSDPGTLPFFYWLGRSHPTALARIRMAEAFEEGESQFSNRNSQ